MKKSNCALNRKSIEAAHYDATYLNNCGILFYFFLNVDYFVYSYNRILNMKSRVHMMNTIYPY